MRHFLTDVAHGRADACLVVVRSSSRRQKHGRCKQGMRKPHGRFFETAIAAAGPWCQTRAATGNAGNRKGRLTLEHRS